MGASYIGKGYKTILKQIHENLKKLWQNSFGPFSCLVLQQLTIFDGWLTTPPFLNRSIALSNILEEMIRFILRFLWSECASLVKSAGVMTGELRAVGP